MKPICSQLSFFIFAIRKCDVPFYCQLLNSLLEYVMHSEASFSETLVIMLKKGSKFSLTLILQFLIKGLLNKKLKSKTLDNFYS